MDISRRMLMTGAAATMAVPLSISDVLAANAPPLTAAFAADRKSLHATRITAAGVEPFTITAETLGNSPILQFLNRKATAVAVYSAPPKHTIAHRTVSADAPELLFIIKGATVITTDTGPVHCGLGSLTLLESGSVTERSGAQGYTAIKVRMTAS